MRSRLASSYLLQSYGIKHGSAYADGTKVRGYKREQFEEMFEQVLAGRGLARATRIIDRVTRYVPCARFFMTLWFFMAAVSVCVAILAIGFGIAWVRRGFLR